MAYKKNWPVIVSISMVLVLVALILVHIHGAPKENNKIMLFAEENKPENNVQVIKKPSEVNFKGKTIKVEVVSNPQDMYLGLSGRENLCPNCGMLFAFPDKAERKFVMRNMLFPLDIIFISDNKVVNVHKNCQPEGANYQNVYSCGMPANYVLEVNAGLVDEFGIKIGDEIEF